MASTWGDSWADHWGISWESGASVSDQIIRNICVAVSATDASVNVNIAKITSSVVTTVTNNVCD